MADRERENEHEGGVDLKERSDERVRKPSMYRVIILNDDYTPIDFVVNLVSQVFRKTVEEAARITLDVHNKGYAVAGVYTYEIAETKVAVAEAHAARHEHPLQLVMEPED
jgi:ATP-dependent Clp protease adaptor protein ClpS